MQIPIPNSNRKKCLFIVDCQPGTLTAKKVFHRIPLIADFIKKEPYNAYVEAVYYSDETSHFYKQEKHLLPMGKAGDTADEIKQSLADINISPLRIVKDVRSCFQSGKKEELLKFLSDNKIEECHFIGFDINSCVLGTLLDAFDLGYFSYAIEELCDINNGDKNLRQAAIDILRWENMTNHSTLDDVKVISLDDQ